MTTTARTRWLEFPISAKAQKQFAHLLETAGEDVAALYLSGVVDGMPIYDPAEVKVNLATMRVEVTPKICTS